MEETGILYKLTFPNGKSYIGITKYSIEHRIKIHIRASRSGRKLAIYNAIRKYGEDSFEVQVLAIAHPDDLPRLEIEAIREHDTFGPNGYNLTAGGEGTLGRSFIVSEETKAKISKTTKGRIGRPISEETKQKLRNANLGKKASEATKKKISASLIGKQKGKIISEDTKAKISASLTGRKLTEEQKYNLTKSRADKVTGMTGKSHSENTKQKIALSRIGKRIDYQHSEETKRKISEGNKGKIISEESKAKMSAAAKNRYAKNRLEKDNATLSMIF
ncbi:NUMOD3 domain-containing DNA-binding protein [Methylobacter luteus]|uniref:NUMOD3 domain-containing DNA-binding protein n=1 Tax=Methylobacter luteus TaxID=415 RepID=UPI000423DA3E|nr:NUMOD3 domain-containing DNA-binding protein [Methylobacter luteus]